MLLITKFSLGTMKSVDILLISILPFQSFEILVLWGKCIFNKEIKYILNGFLSVLFIMVIISITIGRHVAFT